MVQYGFFKKQRGVANSRSHELLFLCYKGRLPKQLAKMRAHVDAGSLVFNEVVRNVPVLSQKRHALVSREIREKSLQSMIGVDVTEAEAKDPEHQAPRPWRTRMRKQLARVLQQRMLRYQIFMRIHKLMDQAQQLIISNNLFSTPIVIRNVWKK